MVALEDPTTKTPNLSTLKLFKCDLSQESIQGFNYKVGVWHHPMVVVGTENVDFMALVWERQDLAVSAVEDTTEYYFTDKEVFYITGL